MNLTELAAKLALFFVPFLFALCFHEFAHGWVAKLKGDRTAEMMGRLTLNPFAHMDLVGTILLPIMAIISQWALFGWAKPVPVNPRNLKNPKNDMFWIALAGPASNLLLAIVAGFVLILMAMTIEANGTSQAVAKLLDAFIYINILLAVFNMIPLHPLDGGKVLARFLPEEWNQWLESHQNQLSIALMIFFVAGGFRYLAQPILFLHETLKLSVYQFFHLIS